MYALLLPALLLLAPGAEPAALSLGGGSCGKLQGGVAVRCSGDNFQAFTPLACTLGRNHLHPRVARTVEDAYALLATRHPGRTWQYGDLGHRHGGRFPPHRTHQVGTSADFMVPVEHQGAPALLSIHPFNLMGYGIEFDARGRHGDHVIAWRALADHLAALDEAGAAHGVTVRRVILDAPLRQRLLREAPTSRAFAGRFNRGKPWVRHDEHYHVEFSLPATDRRPLSCR